MSMPGRRVFAPPMSDHLTIPSASAAARSTFARSGAPCARADWTTSTPTSANINAAETFDRMGLMVFLRDGVREVTFAAWLRFRQHRVRLRIQQRHARRRRPRLEQVLGVLDRRGPCERVAVAMEALDHMHVFAVHVSTDLIEPGVAVEAIRVDDERVAVPVPD